MPPPVAEAPSVQGHIRTELTRLLSRLDNLLQLQRRRGRSTLGDPVRGLVIEDGEAEGLIEQLGDRLADGAGASTRVREWFDAQPAAFDASGRGGVPPLIHAARRFELTPAEYDAVLLALAVEWDSRFGRLVAYLNDNVNQARPTLGLALALADGEFDHEDKSPLSMMRRPVVRDGLLEIEGNGPAPGRALRLDDDVALRLFGEALGVPSRVVVHSPEPGLLERLILTGECRRALDAWCSTHRQAGRAPVLLVGGPKGSGRTTIARACAGELALPLAVADLPPELDGDALRAARREARWFAGALLLRIADLGTTRPATLWEQVDGIDAPVFICAPLKIAELLLADAPRRAALVRIDEPDAAARARLWRHLLPTTSDLDVQDIDALATRFRFGPGRTAQAIARARATASLGAADEASLDFSRVAASCREVGATGMSDLAEALPLPYTMGDLVVRDDVCRELELAVAWVRHRRHVYDGWGFGKRLAHVGLTAIFSGPPGCGKTMAAQVLARELGVMLYLVDLSRVLSKWIGETERNLGRLFDEAYASGCALFFDEADALFGKRSEVKDARDRYANVETGYLLSRMEQTDGITILASNRPGDLDEAFLRRLQLNVQFPMPNEEDRRRIWRGIFPREASLAPDVDLDDVARSFELSGGEIRNAALAAAFLSASSDAAITQAHVRRAAAREMRKSGRVVPDEFLRRADY